MDDSTSEINSRTFDYEQYLSASKQEFLKKWMNPRRSDAKFEHFDILTTIGVGGFGRIRLVKKKSDEKYYAVKILVKKDVIESGKVEDVLKEKRILQAINFPFIVNINCWFQDNSYLYMVMEYVCGGNLCSHIEKMLLLPEYHAKFYASQVVLALEYLHNVNVIHRDLKLDNLVIDQHGYLKVTDFGLAELIEVNTSGFCGTPTYMAPEIIEHKRYNKAVDWWALGVVIYLMVAGEFPFDSFSDQKLCKKIVFVDYKLPEDFSMGLCRLIMSLFQYDPNLRLGNKAKGATDVKNHLWFNSIHWGRIFQKQSKAPFRPKLRSPGSTDYFGFYRDELIRVRNRNKYGEIFEEF